VVDPVYMGYERHQMDRRASHLHKLVTLPSLREIFFELFGSETFREKLLREHSTELGNLILNPDLFISTSTFNKLILLLNPNFLENILKDKQLSFILVDCEQFLKLVEKYDEKFFKIFSRAVYESFYDAIGRRFGKAKNGGHPLLSKVLSLLADTALYIGSRSRETYEFKSIQNCLLRTRSFCVGYVNALTNRRMNFIRGKMVLHPARWPEEKFFYFFVFLIIRQLKCELTSYLSNPKSHSLARTADLSLLIEQIINLFAESIGDDESIDILLKRLIALIKGHIDVMLITHKRDNGIFIITFSSCDLVEAYKKSISFTKSDLENNKDEFSDAVNTFTWALTNFVPGDFEDISDSFKCTYSTLLRNTPPTTY
jgi:hypothetical protein